jgi:hypothetical protein
MNERQSDKFKDAAAHSFPDRISPLTHEGFYAHAAVPAFFKISDRRAACRLLKLL